MNTKGGVILIGSKLKKKLIILLIFQMEHFRVYASQNLNPGAESFYTSLINYH
jgi:hypothetical protein